MWSVHRHKTKYSWKKKLDLCHRGVRNSNCNRQRWRTAPPKSFAFCHSIVRSSRYFTTICFSAFWPHHLSILSIIGDGRAVLMPESHANGTYVVRPISRGCQQSICAHSSPALSLCVLLICFCIIFSWNAFLRLLLLTPLLVHIQLNYRLTTHENAKHQIDGRIVFGKTNGMFHSIYSIFCLVLVVLLEWAIIFDWWLFATFISMRWQHVPLSWHSKSDNCFRRRSIYFVLYCNYWLIWKWKIQDCSLDELFSFNRWNFVQHHRTWPTKVAMRAIYCVIATLMRQWTIRNWLEYTVFPSYLK